MRRTAPRQITNALEADLSFQLDHLRAAGAFALRARRIDGRGNGPVGALAHRDLLDQYSDDNIHDVVAYLWTLK